jgi:MoaA/NifB/PqqE/SkfB family radical SAM enzyme
MISIDQIKDVHIELTTLCNARCPMCERNANGFPYNFGYPESSLSLSDIQKIFSCDFIKQLRSFTVCGNYGDFVACPDALEIINYVRASNSDIKITISTNGSARNNKFWTQLSVARPEVSFCIDGLEDTHSLYRLDTNWAHIIRNAGAFISAGGSAVWKMIKFDHNQHQVDACRKLAHDLGFIRFDLADHGRSSGSAFDRSGNLTHQIGSGIIHTTTENIIHWKHHTESIEWVSKKQEKNSLDCYSQRAKSIYVAGNGEVYPCCYLGFFPRTFANSHWYSRANGQLTDLLTESNNAVEVGLEAAIDWFSKIQQKWAIEKYQDGRLLMCDEHCGSDRYVFLERQKL